MQDDLAIEETPSNSPIIVWIDETDIDEESQDEFESYEDQETQDNLVIEETPTNSPVSVSIEEMDVDEKNQDAFESNREIHDTEKLSSDCESVASSELKRTCSSSIFVGSTSNQKGRKYDKRDACFYCKEQILSTNLAKHLTRKHKDEVSSILLFQLGNFSETDFRLLCDHMGHTVPVHNRWYRLRDSTAEMTVCKMLIADGTGIDDDDIGIDHDDDDDVPEEEEVPSCEKVSGKQRQSMAKAITRSKILILNLYARRFNP